MGKLRQVHEMDAQMASSKRDPLAPHVFIQLYVFPLPVPGLLKTVWNPTNTVWWDLVSSFNQKTYLLSFQEKIKANLIIGFALQTYLWGVQIRKYLKYLIYFGWGFVALARQNVIWEAVISLGGQTIFKIQKKEKTYFQRDSWVWYYMGKDGCFEQAN